MITTRFLRQAAFCSLMTMLVSSVLQAQPASGGGQPPQEGGRQRGGGRGGFGGGFGGGFAPRVDRATLLGNDKVREELKIEEAQAATIEAALEAFREERNNSPRLDRDAIQNMSEEERTAAFEKFRKEREELSKNTDEVLNALLEAPQTKRLDEISFQVRINMAVFQTLKADDIKEKLTITEDQVAGLTKAEETIAAEAQKAREERQASGAGAPGGGGPGGGFDPAAFQAMFKAAQEKSTTAAMAVLTDAQKTSIEEMKGAAFELDMMSLMGGRGGPGGGRGGPGGGGRPGGGRGNRPPAE